ncbi:MAG: helix-turn-helix transcriptional regulator [Clostridia bacterium]
MASQDEAASTALAKAAAKSGSAERGCGFIDPEAYRHFLEQLETLSPAERRVFNLYMQDRKAGEIAEELHISINTVKYHNGNIYGKLEVGSRKELFGYIRYMRRQQKEEEGKHGGQTD